MSESERTDGRQLRVAAAQLGPIGRNEARADVIDRLLALLNEAARDGAELVVFPELALTTFFPRWYTDDLVGHDHFFETEMPSVATQPLFDRAKELGIGFMLGYAELTPDQHRYNTSILVDCSGVIVRTFRKVHIPGHEEHEPWRPFQHLERRYFEPSPDGFVVDEAFGAKVGMAICNDRRWPETYREMGLEGVELVLIGYNTPLHYPPDPSQDELAEFHNRLCMQAGAYQNGTWVVGVAKGGVEEGVEQLAESSIISPSGEIVAIAQTADDEIVIADCDFTLCDRYKKTLFDFDRYRRPDVYHRL